MSQPTLSALHAAYERTRSHHEALERSGVLADDSHVSDFWRDILEDERRRSYPTFEEILVLRRGFTFPLADRGRAADRAAEAAYFAGALHVVRSSMGDEAIARIEESALGAPVPFDALGQPLSAGALVNGLTAERVIAALERHGARRPLRILEIGAGYGAVADQLLRRLDVERYVVCDLAPNLFLSGFYLPANHPQRPVAFLGGADRAVPAGGLGFLVPQHLDLATGPWDLVLNSYSFQEMDRSSVDAYFAHAASRLAPDGLLYSLNAHGKAGVRRPSQYPTTGFEVLEVAPVRRYPWQVFGTVPYELVLRTGEGDGQPERLDGVGAAIGLGLYDELASADAAWWSAASRLLWDGGDRVAALATLQAVDRAPEATAYVAATLAFAQGAGPQALDGIAEQLPPGHARVRAGLMAAAAHSEQGDAARAGAALADAIALAPHLAVELRELAAAPHEVRAFVADQVGEAYSAPSRWELRRRVRRAGRNA